jgi:hypothetical protein
MSKRSESIAALLARCAGDIQALETAYADALSRQTIPADLKIDIKNLAGNLRSVLDYVGADVREVCCPTANPKDWFYFPVLQSEGDFVRKTSEWYPGLATARPAVWAYLRSVQPYHPQFRWLGQLNSVNNENKHGDLVEQTRGDSPRVSVTLSGGGGVSWDPRAVRFGSGVFIGGVPVNPATQLPVPHESHKVERVTWIDFRFRDPDVSALGLLKQSIAGVRKIAHEIAELL